MSAASNTASPTDSRSPQQPYASPQSASQPQHAAAAAAVMAPPLAANIRTPPPAAAAANEYAVKPTSQGILSSANTYRRQLTALLWKNYLMKRRAWFSTLLEIGLPVAVMGLLIWVRIAVPRESHPGSTGGGIVNFDEQRFALGLALATKFSMPGYALAKVVFIPSPQVDSMALTFQETYPEFATNVVTMGSDDELNNYILDPTYPSDGPVLAGIIINKFGSAADPTWSYTLRENSTGFIPTTQGNQFNTLSDAPNGDWNDLLMQRGHMFLQNFIENYIITHSTQQSITLSRSFGAAAFPNTAYYSDNFMTLMSQFIGIFFTLVYIWPLTRLVKAMVQEKEYGISENLAMMGLSSTVSSVSWFITYGFLLLLTAGAIVAETYSSVFKFSSPGYMILYFWLFGINVFAFALMMSTFFTSSRTAATMSALIFLTLYFAFYAVNTGTASTGAMTAACLHAPICFGLAATTIGQFETAGIGLNSFSLSTPVNGFTFDIYIGMMVADFFLYIFIAIVVTWVQHSRRLKVVQMRAGYMLSQMFHPYDSYKQHQLESAAHKNKQVYTGDSAGKQLDRSATDGTIVGGMSKHSDASQQQRGNDSVEGVSDNISRQLSISINALTKQFPTESGKLRTVVNNFSLNLYRNQILSLLGHNGAGKTTLISMLTGVHTPSNGDAIIDGKSINTHMSIIRKELGVCTQHNALYDNLTVQEHLSLYAYIKNVPRSERSREVKAIAKAVGLDHMMGVMSAALSGGYKRKLCVALALIGGSKIVFLDEPTAGMDPYSRRSTWDVLRKFKEGRTIILTTHLMDEADYLGDRIAIMSAGQLQCCGSSLWLKNRYGVGYNLTIAKKPGCDVQQLEGVVKEHVPEAEGISNAGAEFSMRLPTSESSKFAALFDDLDAQSEHLGIDSYGMSMTTLEEVFLRVGAEGSNNRNNMFGARRLPRAPSFSSAIVAGAGSTLNRQYTESVASNNMHRRQHSESMVSQNGHSPAFYMAQTQQNTPAGTPPRRHSVRVPTQGNQSVDKSHLQAPNYLQEPGSGSRQQSLAQRYDTLPQPPSGMDVPAHYRQRSLQVAQAYHPEVDAPTMDRQFTYESAAEWMHPEDASHHINQNGHVVQLNKAKQLDDTESIKSDTEHFVWLHSFLHGASDYMSVDSFSPFGDRGRRFFKHYRACFMKRVHNAQRDKRTWLWTIGYPLVITAFGLGMVNISTPLNGQDPAYGVSVGDIPNLPTTAPYAFSGTNIFTSVQHNYVQDNQIDFVTANNVGVNSNNAMQRYLINTFYNGDNSRYMAFASTNSWNPSSGDLTDNTKIYLNTTYVWSLPLAYNTYSNLLLQQVTGNPDASISTTVYPLPTLGSAVPLTLALIAVVMALGFAFLPAHFIAYAVMEKRSKIKQQQMLSGCSTNAYWLASFSWDLINYIIPGFILLGLVVAYNVTQLIGPNIPATIVDIVLFGLAVIPFSYSLSFIFKDDTSAQNMMLVLFIVTGAVLLIASLALDQTSTMSGINDNLKFFYRVFPSYAFGEALSNLILRSSQYFYATPQSIWALNITGWPFIYMGAEFVLGFIVLYFLERLSALSNPFARLPSIGSCFRFLCCCGGGSRRSRARTNTRYGPGFEEMDEEDEDVVAEKQRLMKQDGTPNQHHREIVSVHGLRKTYSTSLAKADKVAVEDLWLGIPEGQCFGFLGTNGAGKTTTMKMITGDMNPSAGTAFLKGYNLTTQFWKIRNYLGYCPQFDALIPSMTAREHLILFSRLKGVKESRIREYVNEMIRALGLQEGIADEAVGKYSGGNKRKVCVGIALLGDPSIVLLDEPSAGMDPRARRFMWDLISSSLKRRSVILTTHSMEEAEALTQRTGIMVAGKLRALGSNQHLKAKFGKFYQVDAHVMHGTMQNRFKEFIYSTFVGAQLSEERGDNIKMRIPKEYTTQQGQSQRQSIGSIFRVMEAHKKRLGCDEYSVSEVTLEQVFLEFARQQEHANMTEDQREHEYAAAAARAKEETRSRRLKRLRRLQRARRRRAVTRARAASEVGQARGSTAALDDYESNPPAYLSSAYQDALTAESGERTRQHDREDSDVRIDMENAGDLQVVPADQLNNNAQPQVVDAPALQRFMSERPITGEDLDRGYNSNYEFASDLDESEIDDNAPPTVDELRVLQAIEEKEEEAERERTPTVSRLNSARNSSRNVRFFNGGSATPTSRPRAGSDAPFGRRRGNDDNDDDDFHSANEYTDMRPRSMTDRLFSPNRFAFKKSVSTDSFSNTPSPRNDSRTHTNSGRATPQRAKTPRALHVSQPSTPQHASDRQQPMPQQQQQTAPVHSFVRNDSNSSQRVAYTAGAISDDEEEGVRPASASTTPRRPPPIPLRYVDPNPYNLSDQYRNSYSNDSQV